MTRRSSTTRPIQGRRGITLTEILISIMVMGIGMLSLATLFPLGLLRLRAANRATRSAYIGLSASSDVSARNLLSPNSFAFVPWYLDTNGNYTSSTDPFINDAIPSASGVYYLNRAFGPGLPVVYDPLWHAVTENYTFSASTRFGSGIGVLRDSTSGNGLQRLTNFCAFQNGNTNLNLTVYPVPRQVFDFNAVIETFVSPEDKVFQNPKATNYLDPNTPNTFLANPSPVVADLSISGSTATLPNVTLNLPQHDWRYTWLMTLQQTDATNASVFDGYVVVMENRQFGLDPISDSVSVPTGETTVEAIFGPGTIPNGQTLGYGRSAKRMVLLRWSALVPDPEIKVGQWFADVTYDIINAGPGNPRYASGTALYPAQRCYWYQITKRTDPQPSSIDGMREVTVWVGSDLRAQTLLNADGSAYNVEAALICPSVINVIPRTIVVH